MSLILSELARHTWRQKKISVLDSRFSSLLPTFQFNLNSQLYGPLATRGIYNVKSKAKDSSIYKNNLLLPKRSSKKLNDVKPFIPNFKSTTRRIHKRNQSMPKNLLKTDQKLSKRSNNNMEPLKSGLSVKPSIDLMKSSKSAKSASTQSSTVAPKSAIAPISQKYHANDAYLVAEKVQKMAKEGQLQEAIEMVKDARLDAQSVVVWNHIINECGKAGKFRLAYRMFLEMKRRGFVPNGQSYTHLLSALEHGVNIPRIAELALHIYQTIIPSKEYSIAHTNSLINILARNRTLKGAKKIFSEMPKLGHLQADKITFMTMINAVGWQRGDEGFMDMIEIWNQLQTRIIESAQESSQQQDLLNWPKWQPLALDEPMILGILNGCTYAESHQNIAKGFTIVESMYGIHPPSLSRTAGYIPPSSPAIRESLGQQGGDLIAPLSPAIANKILSLCFRTVNYELGQEFVDDFLQIPEFIPDVELFNSLIQLNLKINTNNFERRRELAEDSIAVLKTIRLRNLHPNLDTYRRVLYACTLLDADQMWSQCKKVLADLEQEERWTAAEKLTPDRRVYLDIKCCLSIINCARFSANDKREMNVLNAIKILKDANWLRQLKTLSTDIVMGRARKFRGGPKLVEWADELMNAVIEQLELLLSRKGTETKTRERYELELLEVKEMKNVFKSLPKKSVEEKQVAIRKGSSNAKRTSERADRPEKHITKSMSLKQNMESKNESEKFDSGERSILSEIKYSRFRGNDFDDNKWEDGPLLRSSFRKKGSLHSPSHEQKGRSFERRPMQRQNSVKKRV